jgi:hypothetical protein
LLSAQRLLLSAQSFSPAAFQVEYGVTSTFIISFPLVPYHVLFSPKAQEGTGNSSNSHLSFSPRAQ